MSMSQTSISKRTLLRLTQYLNYLKRLDDGREFISSAAIAEALGLNQVQVRKDLACVSSGGRPKVGYPITLLIKDLKSFLGYQDVQSAIVVGAGRLGKALLGYEGFSNYNFDVIAAFDQDQMLCDQTASGKQILPMHKMKEICDKHQVQIGIITVPSASAQQVCDRLVEIGIEAIWNFASTHLTVPQHVFIQNENMAASLGVLSQHLARTRNNASTKESLE